jgi:hypothetical protein
MKPFYLIIRTIVISGTIFFSQGLLAQVFTDSNLPIVIINTDNGVEIPDDPRVLGNMKIIYRGEGNRNYLADQSNPQFLNYDGRIDIEIRGSSSQMLPKKAYGLTTRMADNVSNNNVSLLGMPSENDWILNGLAFDPSLIRDYLSYNLARAMGNYASRTVYVEVVINGEYKGLYVLQEKIKADGERVNVTKIGTSHNTLPNLSGGYITKADKTTGGDPVAWTMMGTDGWEVDYIHALPKPEDVTVQQNAYIHNEFLKLAANTSNTSLQNGYPSLIDIPSFVDFFISNELASNVDGYALSTFFHKDRNGKLRAGPIWDFNLTYGNDLFDFGYDRSHTNVWQFNNGDNTGSLFWYQLFQNPTFRCYLARRWNELTQTGQPLNITSLNTYIDNTINHISEAAIREQIRWNTIPNLDGEIFSLKLWLSQRITWLNNNIGSFSACASPALPPLVITKINYNPGTSTDFSNSNDQEFIAIQNTASSSVDVSGVYFRGTGLVYQFPYGQSIAGGSTIYLASKSTVFQNRYGITAFGEFTRNLSNSSQELVLADAFGNIIDRVHYSDSAPWPDADGNGNYLLLTDTSQDNALASSWTAADMDALSVTESAVYDIKVYPNPVSKLLTIATGSGGIEFLKVFDITGKCILTKKTDLPEIHIDTEDWQAGVYFICLLSEGKSTIRKLIKL